MKAFSIFARTVAFLAVLLLAAPQIAGAASPADEDLQKRVEKTLVGDQPFDATSIIVTAEDGVVNLRGSVVNRSDVKKMKEAAERIPGVKRVETQIEVKGDQTN